MKKLFIIVILLFAGKCYAQKTEKKSNKILQDTVFMKNDVLNINTLKNGDRIIFINGVQYYAFDFGKFYSCSVVDRIPKPTPVSGCDLDTIEIIRVYKAINNNQ